jgi:hypothetical protein
MTLGSLLIRHPVLGEMKMLNLVCGYGDCVLVFEPAGFDGYEALVDSSITITAGSNEVTVASLADVFKSKEMAVRRKDLETLDVLKRFLVRSNPGHEVDF